MVDVIAQSNRVLTLGRQGENLAVRIVFDVSSWSSLVIDGEYCNFSLVNKRPGDDEETYICETTYSEDKVYWIIKSADVANVGKGNCELVLTVGDAVAKSITYTTVVYKSLVESETPPEPYQDWVDSVIAAKNAAATSASEAATFASAAAESAETAKSISDLTVTSTTGETGSQASVTKTVDENGKINLEFTIPCGSNGESGSGGTAEDITYDSTLTTHTAGSVGETLSKLGKDKQDTISDIEKIRDGAALGATALQSYTETDPTVPNWAKASSKPNYTAEEITDGTSTVAAELQAYKEDLDALASHISYTYTKDKSVGKGTLTPKTESGWECAIVDCSEGDVFRVKGKGGRNTLLWCFAQDDGTTVSCSESGVLVEDYIEITAPANATKLVVNNNYSVADGGLIKDTGTPADRVDKIEQDLSGKQDTLTAGAGITISDDNVISTIDDGTDENDKANSLYNLFRSMFIESDEYIEKIQQFKNSWGIPYVFELTKSSNELDETMIPKLEANVSYSDNGALFTGNSDSGILFNSLKYPIYSMYCEFNVNDTVLPYSAAYFLSYSQEAELSGYHEWSFGVDTTNDDFQLYATSSPFHVNGYNFDKTVEVIVPKNTLNKFCAVSDNKTFLKIWLNGELAFWANFEIAEQYISALTSSSLCIGTASKRLGTTVSRSFDGYVKNVKVYTRILADEEALAMTQSEVS